MVTSQQADPNGHRRLMIREILGTEREVLIVHGERSYRLRITRTAKLILTK